MRLRDAPAPTTPRARPGRRILRALALFPILASPGCLVAGGALGLGAQAAGPVEAGAQMPDDPGWQELAALDSALIALSTFPREEGVPRYDPETVGARADSLEALRRRLEGIDASGWSVAGKVDYLLVWSRGNALEFEHRVTRPWRRDPILYLNHLRPMPYVDLPLEGAAAERWRRSLRAVPGIVEVARARLTQPQGELADLTLFHLENFDGVGRGEPYRDDPPEGTIGWYEDLCGRVERHHPGDLPACEAALDAVRSFRDWLEAERSGMPPSAGIGTENLAWYLHHVRLVPYGVDELLTLGEREFHRYRTAYETARNRNRDLPELTLTRSREEHRARTREAERKIRALIREQELLTLPDWIPDAFETDTFWSPRARTDRHFWEELQFRNALNNHIHASIPGHRFDRLLIERLENPIRRRYPGRYRSEGWATYLEEMLLEAGLTRETPRVDELFYIALMKRASRIFAETAMHAGTFSLDEANRYMIDLVPFMEEDLGRYDLEGYLRRPGSGSAYIVGKVQIEKLLAERAMAEGDAFHLGAFHDALLAHGPIPLALIRWEMTGATDEVEAFWRTATGEELGAGSG